MEKAHWFILLFSVFVFYHRSAKTLILIYMLTLSFTPLSDISQIQCSLPSDFNAVQKCFFCSKLTLNKKKSYGMLLNTRPNSSQILLIHFLDGSTFEKVKKCKYLGLWLTTYSTPSSILKPILTLWYLQPGNFISFYQLFHPSGKKKNQWLGEWLCPRELCLFMCECIALWYFCSVLCVFVFQTPLKMR